MIISSCTKRFRPATRLQLLQRPNKGLRRNKASGRVGEGSGVGAGVGVGVIDALIRQMPTASFTFAGRANRRLPRRPTAGGELTIYYIHRYIWHEWAIRLDDSGPAAYEPQIVDRRPSEIS